MMMASFTVSSVTSVLSLVLIVVSVTYLYLQRDNGLTITLTEPCTGWDTMASLFNNASSLSHAELSRAQAIQFTPNGSAPGAPLLQQLLDAACCTLPTAGPGATPANRSDGCACIAGQYWGFVADAINMTSNITDAVRSAHASSILNCLEYRPVYQVVDNGEVHPVSLALYANCVLFLCMFAYWFFRADLALPFSPFELTYTYRKVLLGGVVLALSLPFFLIDGQYNYLNGIGLYVVGLSLLYTLHGELDFNHKQEGRGTTAPFRFDVCLFSNIQLLFPAYAICAAIAGFGRDTYCVTVFGFVAGLVGISSRVSSRRARPPRVPL